MNDQKKIKISREELVRNLATSLSKYYKYIYGK